MNRPTIVCLCGSTRFKEQFELANRNETLSGKIVLSVGFFTHIEELALREGYSPVARQRKEMLDELHKRKIDLADGVFVLNVAGYIGESTRSEILYAQSLNKPIRYLVP